MTSEDDEERGKITKFKT
ncbi:BnaCnng53300D [Brassica napus]|uniref:BnaCnng53300D protein n=2 Tax=Brassica TaxID=3705 RepID=A0A078JJU4_BRANA|nr:BnaCnng53300D [Brassica napus]